jgi:hypothetical protein
LGSDAFSGVFPSNFVGDLTLNGFENATLQVGGDFDGSLTVNAPGFLQQLTVAGTLTAASTIDVANVIGNLSVGTVAGSVSAGNIEIATITVLGPTGIISVQDVLGSLAIGTNHGAVSAGDIQTLSVGNAGVEDLIVEGGVTRTLAVRAAPGFLPPQTFGYYYDGTGFGNPILTVLIDAGPDPQVDFDLLLLTDTVGNPGSGIDLAGLYSTNEAHVRNIVVAGDLRPESANPGFFGLPGTTPGGVQLPQDDVGSVAFGGNVPASSILVRSVSAVAFGSANGIEAACAGWCDAAGLFSQGTLLIKANGVFPVFVGDGKPVAMFLVTVHLQFFDIRGLLFTDQGADSRPVTADVTVVDCGLISDIQRIDFVGEAAGLQTWQPIHGEIKVGGNGSLGDLTLLSFHDTPDITAPRITGNLYLNGQVSGTIRTTMGDFGRAITSASGDIVGVTSVHAALGVSETGRIISAGDLVSLVDVHWGMDGVIGAQKNIGVIQTDASGNAILDSSNRLTRFGGLNVTGGLEGSVVALGNLFGDLTIVGGLSGRIAVQGQGVQGLAPLRYGILGNISILGGITQGAAILSGGWIGDDGIGSTTADGCGTVLNTFFSVKGILGAAGDINFGYVGSLRKASVFENASGVDKAAIDAIFTDQGMPLMVSNDSDLDKILSDLYALRVGSDGRLTGTTA